MKPERLRYRPAKDYSVCIAKIDGKWQFVSAEELETAPQTARSWFDENGDLITEKATNEPNKAQ